MHKTMFKVEYYREDWVECPELVYAVFNSDFDKVQNLLKTESVDQQDQKGRSAFEWSLEISIQHNPPILQKKILSLLLAKKPNPFLNSKSEVGCFEYIYKGHKAEITKLLLNSFDSKNLLNLKQKSELATKALHRGNFEAYQVLIQAWGVKNLYSAPFQTTDLHLACQFGSYLAASKALDTINDVNLLNELGQTPLDLITLTKKGSQSDKKLIQDLLKKQGGVLNYLTATEYIELPIYTKMNHQNYLNGAINVKHPSTWFIKNIFTLSETEAILIIESEKNIDQKDLLNGTALYWSVYKHCLQSDNTKVINKLLERGADPNIVHHFMGSIQDLKMHFNRF